MSSLKTHRQTSICPLLPCSHTLNNLHLSVWCTLQRYRGRWGQESSCWSRCFRVSCPLNAGSVSLGLRRSRPVTFLAAFCNDKNKQIPIKLVYTSFSLLLNGNGEMEFNSLGIINEVKFGTKGSSSQNSKDSIYNIEDVVTVHIVVLLLYI